MEIPELQLVHVSSRYRCIGFGSGFIKPQKRSDSCSLIPGRSYARQLAVFGRLSPTHLFAAYINSHREIHIIALGFVVNLRKQYSRKW